MLGGVSRIFRGWRHSVFFLAVAARLHAHAEVLCSTEPFTALDDRAIDRLQSWSGRKRTASGRTHYSLRIINARSVWKWPAVALIQRGQLAFSGERTHSMADDTGWLYRALQRRREMIRSCSFLRAYVHLCVARIALRVAVSKEARFTRLRSPSRGDKGDSVSRSTRRRRVAHPISGGLTMASSSPSAGSVVLNRRFARNAKRLLERPLFRPRTPRRPATSSWAKL